MYKYLPVLEATGKTIQDISYIRIREGRPVLKESLSGLLKSVCK